jgi:hypothetical protein
MSDAVWHGANFKALCHGTGKEIILRLAHQIERLGKENITESVYNRPRRGRYKRTGAARASIHTEYLESEIAALIGSDSESLTEAREKRTKTGSRVFYFKFLEDGFHTRNGRFIAGHHMLKRALDTVRQGLR